MSGPGRLLLVQRAGWGKSFVYFISAKLLREMGEGTTLLVSPLLALMRNQIAAAEKMGVHAETINSTNPEDWDRIESKLKTDDIDVLCIAPERFENREFRSRILPRISERVAMLAVDEAHCISDWGHDFRPNYRRLEQQIRLLPDSLRIVGTTATANKRVVKDIRDVLGWELKVKRGDLSLPNLSLQTIVLKSQAERMAWLAQNVPNVHGSGIIYALTIADCDRVAAYLRSRGVDAHAYHSEVDSGVRESLESKLLNNEIKALVATTALGMGFDKPDLTFVIHYQSPSSVSAYYQQVGRAGRAVEDAVGILLSGSEDDQINDFFIHSSFPDLSDVDQVLTALEGSEDGMTVTDLENAVNLRRHVIDKTLRLLSFESPSPLGEDAGKWVRTPTGRPTQIWDRVKRVTDTRREEQGSMKEYVRLPSCHMTFLLNHLDNPIPYAEAAAAERASTSVDQGVVVEANGFLRRQWLPIEPRKQWPKGWKPAHLPSSQRVQQGRVLSIYRDSGWGSLVHQGKYVNERFGDRLGSACLQMIEDWDPDPTPTWLTSVPSRTGSDLVESFARDLADELGLPYVATLARVPGAAQQKSMQNSQHQADNALMSMKLIPDSPPDGPLLLVDDMVDSRWTFTVAGYLLLEAGGGPVFPLAFAQTRSDR